MESKRARLIKKTAILLFWLLLWQGISLWVNRPIFLVGPWETLAAVLRLSGTAAFWRSVFSSLVRIGFGLRREIYILRRCIEHQFVQQLNLLGIVHKLLVLRDVYKRQHIYHLSHAFSG